MAGRRPGEDEDGAAKSMMRGCRDLKREGKRKEESMLVVWSSCSKKPVQRREWRDGSGSADERSSAGAAGGAG